MRCLLVLHYYTKSLSVFNHYNKVEMLSVIKYLRMKDKTPLQIFHEMKDTYEDIIGSVFCYPVLGKKIQIL